jgi:transcriptional regulator with XRE-family HTH domain
MDISNTIVHAESDKALMAKIGNFIRQQRLQQNKTQSQLAFDSNINRSTLVDLEQGKRANLITLIQVLRVLHQLHFFNQFEIKQQISPIQLAELEQAKRKRASKAPSVKNPPKSDW